MAPDLLFFFLCMRPGGGAPERSRSRASAFVALRDEAAHLLPGPVDLGLDRSQRQGEFRSDLLVGVLLEEAHQDQLPVTGRQALEVVLDLRPLLEVDDALLGGRGARGRRREAVIDRQILLPAPHEVDEGVARDGVDPLSESVARTVAVIEIFAFIFRTGLVALVLKLDDTEIISLPPPLTHLYSTRRVLHRYKRMEQKCHLLHERYKNHRLPQA